MFTRLVRDRLARAPITMHNNNFSWREPKFTWADLLSVSRIVLLPNLIYAIGNGHAWLAFVTMIVILLTDLLDGWVARCLGQARSFGQVLDSSIDFVVIYVLFTVFFILDHFPWWKWIIVIVPAILIVVTQLANMIKAKEVSLAPALFGKITGAIQYAYLLLLLVQTLWLKDQGFFVMLNNLVFGFLVTFTLLNSYNYVIQCGKILSRERSKGIPAVSSDRCCL